MDIQVLGRKMQVTEGLREHAVTKVDDALKVIDMEPTSVDVVLRPQLYKNQKDHFTAEFTIRLKGYVVRVSATKEDMYAAIDEASHMAARQLRKFKTKMIDRRQRAAKQNGFEDIQPQSLTEKQVLHDEEEIAEDDLLVRTKYIPFTKLTEEEALVQTDLIGHDFFVYEDIQTGNVHVVYRRKDGGYGILKPDTEEK